LGTADLKLGTVILPRSESPQAISRLTEFEWFHKIDSTSDLVTPEIDDLLLEAQKTFQSIDDVIKGMGIPLIVGIMEILFKGTVIKKKDYEIDSIPGKIFSGYQILAYYYVSWSLAIPEMVAQLQLPYEEEYKLALTMSKTTDK